MQTSIGKYCIWQALQVQASARTHSAGAGAEANSMERTSAQRHLVHKMCAYQFGVSAVSLALKSAITAPMGRKHNQTRRLASSSTPNGRLAECITPLDVVYFTRSCKCWFCRRWDSLSVVIFFIVCVVSRHVSNLCVRPHRTMGHVCASACVSCVPAIMTNARRRRRRPHAAKP